MAAWQQVSSVLSAATGPMSRVQLEDKLGVKFGSIATQMERWIKAKLIEDTGDYHYVLTEEGRKKAMEETVLQDITGEPGTGDQAVATTEYKQFERLGALSGCVPAALIKQTADYVFEGGDYKDMKWVAQAMQELGIQTDVRSRWWHCWRGKMRQAIPTDLPAEFLSTESKTGDKKETKGKRDYIMGENDNPIYVGEGLGDLDHAEALNLANIRAGAKVRGAGQTKGESPGDTLAVKAVEKIISDMQMPQATPTDETTKLLTQVKALKELLGVGDKPDSANELTRLIALIKSVKEIMGDNKQAITSNPERYLVDKRTGQMEKITSGEPMIIRVESAPVSQSTPIQMTDRDGKPMVLDLSTYIKLEEHREKQKQNEESHQTKMEIAKTFKDMLHKAGTALSHMAEEEKE